MDRVAAMLILLGTLVSLVLIVLALFAVAPVICSCLLSLVYTLYLFMAYEESGVHHAGEYENRFWTIFGLLLSTALFFAKDSPLAFGRYSPSLGFFAVVLSSYTMHLWDRYMHRLALGRQTKLRRSMSLNQSLRDMKVTVEEQMDKINESLQDIDQLLIPSTINNFINLRFVLTKEKEIISIFAQCDAVALNYLVCHVKLGLLIYKVKDHHNFSGQHRTELIQLLAVDRLPALTVMSRVIVLHALQILKLRANPRAEHWVRNIFLNTQGDDLSAIKTLTDAKGDYFCMNKLIFDDIKSESVRQDILTHFRKEGALQLSHMQLGTKRAQQRQHMAWRKVLSDVDDTLLSSGGSYPAGIDKRYAKKVVYPGVLAFYRELDLGTSGPEEWPDNQVGNLVFLSARPHVYKDMSEKSNFKKFEKLRMTGVDGRKGMHTTPSLLPGDIASGSQYMVTNDFEPLARKKFDNFKRYVSIYPEYQHVFVCDNGQGDVKAGEMMFDNYPYEFEALYVHVVQDIPKTFGYSRERWQKKEFSPCFFRTYPEAALDAASRSPPLIRVSGLRRVCHDSVKDFHSINSKQWQSEKQKADRRTELNQSIWRANHFLESRGVEPVDCIEAERRWKDGEKVKTPFGNGVITSFDPDLDLYGVLLDWRPLDVQVDEHLKETKEEAVRPKGNQKLERRASAPLATVVETDEVTDDEMEEPMPMKVSQAPPKVVHPVEQSLRDGVVKQSKSGEIVELRRSVSSPEGKMGTTSTTSDSSSLSSISSDGSTPDFSRSTRSVSSQVNAKIRGRDISKFVPPSLPSLNKKSSPLFSFWVGSPEPKLLKPLVFLEGDKCSTPYGYATVVEHRREEKIVVVDMLGWTGRGYLREADLTLSKEGILASLFRRQHGTSSTDNSVKQVSFPYAKGTLIRTPFGDSEVVRPLPGPSKRDIVPGSVERAKHTMCLSITSWTLADGSHPKLYCTAETAKTWKTAKPQDRQTGDGILSAFGTLVSSTFDFAGRFSAPPQKVKDPEKQVKCHERFYGDFAAVRTAFGNGRVLSFRESDGFYEVCITSWTLADKTHPSAWLRGVDLSCQIAPGCQEGYPVLTCIGLTGTLESVQATTGIHIVTVPSAGMVMYLQPDAIRRPLKAAVGEDALTAYGEGTVEHYDAARDIYTIKLVGWGARLYAKAETFDRVRDSMRDRDGQFGMNWLLNFFFSSTDDKNETGTRSRSNSIVGSVRSQSARSGVSQ